MGVEDRARADLERGEPWLARDRLVSSLRERPTDPVVLDLLGTAQAALGDLPAAGAAWLLSGRRDEDAAEALGALAGRYRTAHARALALRARGPLEAYPAPAQRRLHVLRAELAAEGWRWEVGTRPTPLRPRRGRHGPVLTGVLPPDRLLDGVQDVLVPALLVAFLVLSAVAYAVGLAQLVRWVWP